MFGTTLKFLGAEQALTRVRMKAEMGLERVGEQAKTLALRYLMLGLAGIVFLGATVFVLLAGFWALLEYNHNPVMSAIIMAVILALIGLLVALIAYGTTQANREAPKLTQPYPMRSVGPVVPTVDDVGRQIERAVQQYGPVQVTAAAVGIGLVAGLMAKNFRQA